MYNKDVKFSKTMKAKILGQVKTQKEEKKCVKTFFTDEVTIKILGFRFQVLKKKKLWYQAFKWE